MEVLQKVDEAITVCEEAMAWVRRGESSLFDIRADIRARAGRDPADLLAAVCERAEGAKVRVDIQTPKGSLRVALGGGVCVRPPDGNWLLPVEVDEEEDCLRVRALLLEVLKTALASPEEVQVKAYPV